jgi:hypothetical protein
MLVSRGLVPPEQKNTRIVKTTHYQGSREVLARNTRVCCKKYIAKSSELQAE